MDSREPTALEVVGGVKTALLRSGRAAVVYVHDGDGPAIAAIVDLSRCSTELHNALGETEPHSHVSGDEWP